MTSIPFISSVGITVATPVTGALTIKANGDTVNRYQVTCAGVQSWGPGGATAVDTNLYRNAADQLKTDDKFLAVLGIGVGNSLAATGPVGTVVRKMEVFDAAGASLGFVPIYNTIT